PRRLRKVVGMTTAKQSVNGCTRHVSALVLLCTSLSIGVATISIRIAAQAGQPRTFSSAEDAAKSLVDTVRNGDLGGLIALFGQDGKDLLDTSDPATARMNRDVFTAAAAEQWHLVDDAADRKTLAIGGEDWPFPVPIVKEGNAWHFDTAAGKEEVL